MFGGHDPREPPLAPASLPIVGHMVGMMKSKFNYYVDLRYVQPLGNTIPLDFLFVLSPSP